jgi:hypothetical protein
MQISKIKMTKEVCHSREGGNPAGELNVFVWIPAFAVMTNEFVILHFDF